MGQSLVLELNEVCPTLLDRYIGEGLLPNFARLRDSSRRHLTVTSDENLTPWTQWTTFHHGVPQSVHGVERLDQHPQPSPAPLWDALAAAGRKVVAFGPMNALPPAEPDVFMVPCPWSSAISDSAKGYSPFVRFVGNQVREHSRTKAGISLTDTAAFAAFWMAHGFSARTATNLAAQIVHEKTGSLPLRWKRACLLDALSWDIFRATMRQQRADVGVLFADSVGYLQHHFWRQAFPEEYNRLTTDEERAGFGDAVRFGYQRLDRIVGDALKMAGDDGTLVLVGALSQIANTDYDEVGGRYAYRPHDFPRLFELSGCPEGTTFQPVMAHEAWANCEGPADAATCLEALENWRIAETGEQLITGALEADTRVFFRCDIERKMSADTAIEHACTGARLVVGDLFTSIGEVCVTRHHRDGVLWVRHPGGRDGGEGEKMPLEDGGNLVRESLLH